MIDTIIILAISIGIAYVSPLIHEIMNHGFKSVKGWWKSH